LQYKNKKNLYKILLGFTISLVGCNWLSLGLLNIFDPQQNLQIKDVIIGEDGIANITVFSLNEVASNITEFQFEYYHGNTKLSNYSRTFNIGSYYVAPSNSPGTPGDEITFSLALYSDDILKYVRDNYAYGVITCELYIIGEDLAGHKINKKIPGKLPALGIDNTPPTADIVVTPASGDCPLTVFFDGSGSTDGDGIGIAKYEWYLPQVSSSIISTEMSFSKELACSLIPATDSDEVITVNLTVIDYHGNEDSAAESVTITKPESDGGCS
jgi:PKD repeat protein